MSFTSFAFFAFLAAVLCCYYAVPLRFRWIVLLAASTAFYLLSSPKTFLFLLFTAVVTFYGGRYIGTQNQAHKQYLKAHSELTRDEKKQLKADVQKKKRRMVALILLLNFGILAAVKYFRALFAAFGIEGVFNLGGLIPLGISFYTFQTAAYIIDLYRGKIEADRSLPRFLLFISFFPQIIQGPIARYDQLAAQLYEGHRFSYTHFAHGAQLILWGCFKKLVIADRAAVLVNQVFDHYQDYQGTVILLALLFYSIQIYGDFSGGIDIARGAAQMAGIDMADNFRRPYFSDSISEFWRRWHMSLSFWCRDYIFYSISLSKTFGKAGKSLRRVLGDRVGKLFPVIVAQMATFLTIGIWHGAEFKYIAYGLYNGGIIILGLLLEPYLKKTVSVLHIDETGIGWRVFRILRTFCLIVLGRVFPISVSFSAAIYELGSVFAGSGTVPLSEQFLSLGLSAADYAVILAGCVLWFVISYRQERGIQIRQSLDQKPLPLRWGAYLGLSALILVLGMYGPGYDAASFIYRGF